MTLQGRVALVTGTGGQGMGRSIALRLARDGAAVVLNYRRKRENAEMVAFAISDAGGEAIAVQGDVSSPDDVERMVAAGVERFGRIDVVVSNAGGPWKSQDITEIDPGHWRAVMAREIDATYLLMRAVLPGMRERRWGRFVSIGGHRADDWPYGPPGAPLDYPLGKAARHWLTRTLAPRERAHGITINAVAPGPTPHITFDEAIAAVRGERARAGDENHPQDIADIVSFLCSDAASQISGAVIPVPGARPY